MQFEILNDRYMFIYLLIRALRFTEKIGPINIRFPSKFEVSSDFRRMVFLDVKWYFVSLKQLFSSLKLKILKPRCRRFALALPRN